MSNLLLIGRVSNNISINVHKFCSDKYRWNHGDRFRKLGDFSWLNITIIHTIIITIIINIVIQLITIHHSFVADDSCCCFRPWLYDFCCCYNFQLLLLLLFLFLLLLAPFHSPNCLLEYHRHEEYYASSIHRWRRAGVTNMAKAMISRNIVFDLYKDYEECLSSLPLVILWLDDIIRHYCYRYHAHQHCHVQLLYPRSFCCYSSFLAPFCQWCAANQQVFFMVQ